MYEFKLNFLGRKGKNLQGILQKDLNEFIASNFVGVYLVALLDLWSSNPEAISSFTIKQIVSSAGDGRLKDNSICAQELRHYLSQVNSDKLTEYIDHCLEQSFDASGIVLQDLVNEVGRRLDFNVTNGNYRGSAKKVGYDGIWVSPEGHTIIIEVKTTDAYRISLDVITEYRTKLINQSMVTPPVTILIIVGREDTGELESQIRGSRYAWDIRLISTDSLTQLLKVKESTDEPETLRRIHEILVPKEYTKLDVLVGTLFTTARDVESSTISEPGDQGIELVQKKQKGKANILFTDSRLLDKKREDIVGAITRHNGIRFIKKTRAMYWDSSHEYRLVCTVSKRYEKSDNQRYWYAYHPRYHKFISESKETGYFVLGCMDLDIAFLIPAEEMHRHLDDLNTTVLKDRNTLYWHIILSEKTPGKFELTLPKRSEFLSINKFMINI